MGKLRRAAETFGLLARAEGDTPTGGSGVTPPARSAVAVVTPDMAVTLSDVFRGLQVIGTAAGQLTVDHYRGDVPSVRPHALVRRPSTLMSARQFYEQATLDLATCGNAYWRRLRGPMTGDVVDLQLLRPAEVGVAEHPDTGRVEYWHRGQKLPDGELRHLKLLPRTGYPLGLGPIQAAQVELQGTLEARDYSSTWLSTTDVPTGVLTTDQPLTPDQAKGYKTIWRGDGEEYANGHGIRVLGQGLKYTPLQISPKDAQFLETRQFNKAQLADLLGIPLSLLHASIAGASQTYQNVEQEWIAFVRFTLMQYLVRIEDALSEELPHGNTARFNVDGLLRTDTKTRYESHEIGLRAGFLTVPEVRSIEGLPPLTDAQLAELTPTTTTPEGIAA